MFNANNPVNLYDADGRGTHGAPELWQVLDYINELNQQMREASMRDMDSGGQGADNMDPWADKKEPLREYIADEIDEALDAGNDYEIPSWVFGVNATVESSGLLACHIEASALQQIVMGMSDERRASFINGMQQGQIAAGIVGAGVGITIALYPAAEGAFIVVATYTLTASQAASAFTVSWITYGGYLSSRFGTAAWNSTVRFGTAAWNGAVQFGNAARFQLTSTGIQASGFLGAHSKGINNFQNGLLNAWGAGTPVKGSGYVGWGIGMFTSPKP